MRPALPLFTALLLFPLAMAAAEAPVIHYRFDSAPNGVVTNRAGAGFSGALKGSAQVTPVTEGSDSKALSLDGKTGFIEVQGAKKLHIGPEGFSVVATVRFAADEKDAATPDAGDMILFKQGEFLFGRNGDKLYFNLHDGTDWKSPVLAGPVPRGQWCHVAVIVTRQFEPAQGVNGYTVLMFLNGEPIKKVEARNLEVPATSHPVNVGKGFGGPWFCHGELAELAVYQRPLLDDELNTLLAAEKLAKVEVRHITKPDPRYAPLLAEIRADLQQKTMGERLPFERLLAAVEQASSHVSSQTELLPCLETVRKLSASSANSADAFTKAHSQFTFLDNGLVGLTFFASQPKAVALCGIFDFTARRELLGEQRALWSLNYEPARGGGAQELESVAPSVEAILSVDRAKNEAVLAFSHAATEEHPFAFAARATLRLNGPRLSLHLDVTNASAEVGLREVVFPAIRLRRLENGMDRLLVPRQSGVLNENPVRTFLSYDGPYPSGAAHMQFFAYYDDRGGAYVACEDGKARSKDLRAAGKDNDCELSCLWHVGGTGGNHFATSGRAAIELFRGDWFDAAQIYKRFARTADWWPASRLRADTPEWYRNMTIWFIGNANTAKAADDLLAMREYLELPIGLHWYNWNTQPFDDDYPHFTPREGFVDTVARLQSAGVYVKPYINARLWDTRDRGDEDFDYTSVALPATVKDRQGKPVMESYKERLFSPMCPTTEVWQKTMADLCGQLAGYGVAGIYLDQISAGRPRICFDATHPHAAGSGEAWLEQGHWPMLAAIRRDLKRKYPELILNSEDAAEPYMHFLDGYLPWRFLDIGRVPAYQSIYAGRIQMTSRHFSDTTYDALFPKAAEQMLYGEQVGWFGVHHLTANPAFRVFVKKLAHTRQAFLPFFNEGDMLKPAAWASPMPSITSDWGYYGPRIITTPALMHSAWQLGDTIAIIVVNTTSESVTGELMPPVKAWRLPEQVTATDFQENDAPRTASWSTANSRQISVPGYGVAACIIGSNTDIAPVTAAFSKIGKFK